jgi:hypothetical protein
VRVNQFQRIRDHHGHREVSQRDLGARWSRAVCFGRELRASSARQLVGAVIVLPGFKQVTRGEFQEFRNCYAGKLEADVNAIAEPPIVSYCDWSKATSPIGTQAAHDEARQCYYWEPDFYVRQ